MFVFITQVYKSIKSTTNILEKCILKMYFKKCEQKTACFLDRLALDSHISDLDLGEHRLIDTLIDILKISVLDEKHQRYGRSFLKIKSAMPLRSFIKFCDKMKRLSFSAHVFFLPVRVHTPHFFISDCSYMFVRKFTLCTERCFSKLWSALMEQ